MKCTGSSNNSLVILCNNLQKHGDTPNAANYRKLMNMINNGGEDKIDNGMLSNVKIIEELSLMMFRIVNYQNLKLMNYCQIYVVNSLVFYYM